METGKVDLHKLNQMEHVCHIHHHFQWKSTNSISSARSLRGTESMEGCNFRFRERRDACQRAACSEGSEGGRRVSFPLIGGRGRRLEGGRNGLRLVRGMAIGGLKLNVTCALADGRRPSRTAWDFIRACNQVGRKWPAIQTANGRPTARLR
jgi:hypothetical protein